MVGGHLLHMPSVHSNHQAQQQVCTLMTIHKSTVFPENIFVMHLALCVASFPCPFIEMNHAGDTIISNSVSLTRLVNIR